MIYPIEKADVERDFFALMAELECGDHYGRNGLIPVAALPDVHSPRHPVLLLSHGAESGTLSRYSGCLHYGVHGCTIKS